MANWYKKAIVQTPTTQPQALSVEEQYRVYQEHEARKRQKQQDMYMGEKQDEYQQQINTDRSQIKDPLGRTKQQVSDDVWDAAAKPSKGNPFNRILNMFDAKNPGAKPRPIFQPRRQRNPYNRNRTGRPYRMR